LIRPHGMHLCCYDLCTQKDLKISSGGDSRIAREHFS